MLHFTMLNVDDELYLEDIEAHLYSQVFHSNNYETDLEPNNQELNDTMRPPNYYFQPGRTSKSINNNANNNKKHREQARNKTINFMKPTAQRQQRDLPTALNQVVNSFLCIKQFKKPKKERQSKAKRRAARLQRQLQKVLQQTDTVKPVKQPPSLLTKSVEIITLSDSENEDKTSRIKKEDAKCIQISENTTTFDNTENFANDVIFVEPPPIEVINLIEELPEKKPSDIETASTTSSSNKSLSSDVKYLSLERRELLSTPESTSNDFLDNANIDQQNKFNFSLHGADFVNEPNKLTTSNNDSNRNVDICETESTCSTIDVNALKSTVFKEIEFPKDDLFSGANLENFGNLITPNRTKIPTSTPIQKINNKPILDGDDNQSDSSSSDSDLDDTNMNNLQIDMLKKQMNLPNLSPIQAIANDDEENCKTNKKKSPKIGSKFDLIENEQRTKKRKSCDSINVDKKKLNKNKRRKSDVSINKQNLENSCNTGENLIVGDEHESDTLVLHASLNESIENYPEKTVKNLDSNRNINENNMKIEESPEVVIIEQDKNEPIIVSESDSELSDVNEQECQDIKLINCSRTEQPPATVNVENDKEINLINSSVQDVQQTMSDDPKLWEISERDRYYIRRPGSGKRCNKCHEIGHISMRCPKMKGPIKCRLCGVPGHLAHQCPNSMCVQCGNPGNSSTYCTQCYKFREFYCHICGMIGHVKNRCPDLWRRYHLTTENGPLIPHQGPRLKPIEQLWCSSCARPGHLEHVCNFTYTPYAKYDPQIYYYHDIYENVNSIEQLYQPRPDCQYQQPIQQNTRQRYFDANNCNNYQKFIGENLRIINDDTNVDVRFNNLREIVLKPETNYLRTHQYENSVKRVNHYYIFQNKSMNGILYFLRRELQNLYSLYNDIENVVRNLKNSFHEQKQQTISQFYKLLNMTLFGIYCLNNGRMHLQRLENSFISKKNNLITRNKLYKSYCFIFGSDRHENINYRALLSRI